MNRTRYITLMFVLFACLCGTWDSVAEVVSSAANGFSIRVTREISVPSNKVFEVFVQEVGKWWDSAHSFSRNSKNLSIEAKPQGCFCECLPQGGSVAHMTVTYVDPGKRLYADCRRRSARENCVFFPRRKSVRCCSMSLLNPKRSSSSRTTIRPPSDVTRDPWESTFKELLNES